MVYPVRASKSADASNAASSVGIDSTGGSVAAARQGALSIKPSASVRCSHITSISIGMAGKGNRIADLRSSRFEGPRTQFLVLATNVSARVHDQFLQIYEISHIFDQGALIRADDLVFVAIDAETELAVIVLQFGNHVEWRKGPPYLLENLF